VIDIEFEPLFLFFGEVFVHLFVILFLKPEDLVLLFVEFAFFPLFIKLGVALLEFVNILVILEAALLSKFLNEFILDFLESFFDFLFDLFLFSGVE
jgi:hypothetical protein